MKNGYVYVIESDGLVKIGKSANPTERIEVISRMGGRKITHSQISPLCSNYGQVERNLHKEFQNQHFHGEWFDIKFEVAAQALSMQDFSPPQEERPVCFDGFVMNWIAREKEESRTMRYIKETQEICLLDEDTLEESLMHVDEFSPLLRVLIGLEVRQNEQECKIKLLSEEVAHIRQIIEANPALDKKLSQLLPRKVN